MITLAVFYSINELDKITFNLIIFEMSMNVITMADRKLVELFKKLTTKELLLCEADDHMWQDNRMQWHPKMICFSILKM